MPTAERLMYPNLLTSTGRSLRRSPLGVLAVLFVVGGWTSDAARAGDPDAKPAPVDFVRQVQPILAAHCYECHGLKRQEGGLRLNIRSSAFAGGDSGEKAIVPSDLKTSRLVKVIDGSDDELKMPPDDEGKPLTAEQIELVKRWVSQGANWPADADGPATKPTHWAWQKPAKAKLPPVQHAAWPRHPLDYFVLAQLEKAGLAPAPEVDRYTLVRRVHLDLIGLPPTPVQVDWFVDDQQPGAYERMVDRVLADPAYGERWARVWLDLARYADSKGYGSDPLRTIWRYRDWVIEAFNRNMPYDRFTIEQLAGDLLPKPTSDQLLATAFHRNTMANDEGGTDDEEFRVAAVKDRIETTMQVWMGLTMGCAKCHSHKFDPITQREYYQAYAFFDQTEDADRGDEEPKMATPTVLEQLQIADRRARIATLEKQLATPPAGLEAQLAAWEQTVREQAGQWTALEPEQATAEVGTTLQILPDRSVLASGDSPERDTYQISVATEAKGITAFRLEALPHESLPQNGPGRDGGNFVLNELQVTAAPRPAGPTQGRFVRIEIAGDKKIVSLAEVQIFRGDENLAVKGKATQSSTFGGAGPERALDGQTDGDYDKGSVTHTNEEKNPWWEVDLGQTSTLERIAIWNRTDHNLQSRLKDYQLSVLDEQRNPIWQRTIAEAPKSSREIDLREPPQVVLVGATADFSQQDFAIEKAIDGDSGAKGGWGVSPSFGKPHYAVLRTKQPVVFDGPVTLRFTLSQAYGGHNTLGRFRLSATTHQPAAAIPQRIGEILATAAEVRSPADQAELTNYYWTHSPAAEALRGNSPVGQASQGDRKADRLHADHARTGGRQAARHQHDGQRQLPHAGRPCRAGGAGRVSSAARCRRSEPPGPGPLARGPRQPADGPGGSQSLLGPTVRPGHRRHRGGFRHAGIVSHASRSARLAGGRVHRERLGHEGPAAADRHFGHLSPIVEPVGRGAAKGSA